MDVHHKVFGNDRGPYRFFRGSCDNSPTMKINSFKTININSPTHRDQTSCAETALPSENNRPNTKYRGTHATVCSSKRLSLRKHLTPYLVQGTSNLSADAILRHSWPNRHHPPLPSRIVDGVIYDSFYSCTLIDTYEPGFFRALARMLSLDLLVTTSSWDDMLWTENEYRSDGSKKCFYHAQAHFDPSVGMDPKVISAFIQAAYSGMPHSPKVFLDALGFSTTNTEEEAA